MKKSLAVSQVHWRVEHAKAKLNVLRQSIEDALNYLKQNRFTTFFFRPKLPWYLVLGAENAGKTSLLTSKGLELSSIDGHTVQNPSPTAYCHWWFGKETVFIDTSGTLVLPDDPKNDSHMIWNGFIGLLRRYRRYRPVDGLILCIDLHEFQHKQRGQRQLQIDVLRHRIQTLTQFQALLPIYIIFTKCDRIPGFTESFNALSPEDCQQAFGIALPLGLAQQNLPAHLEEKFSAFLQRLNQQLLSRLHREHNIEKRVQIKNFPLQLESQKNHIINLASQLHSTKASLGGVYFTSSFQDGNITDALALVSSNFGLPTFLKSQINYYMPQHKPYFIQQMLRKITQTKSPQTRKIPAFLLMKKKHFYAALGGLFLAWALSSALSYFYNKAKLDHVQHLLNISTTQAFLPITQGRQPMGKAMGDYLGGETQLSLLGKPVDSFHGRSLIILPGLNHLHEALEITNGRLRAPLTAWFQQVDELHQNLAANYTYHLRNDFAPHISKLLELQIQQGTTSKPQQLFSALKVYLMLNDPAHLDKNFVHAWFRNYWRQQDPEHQKEWLTHLSYWLNLSAPNFNVNAAIAQVARQKLNSLPLSELTYLNLQEKYDSIPFARKVLANNSVTFAAPLMSLYSADNFNTIYNREIPELAQHLAMGDDWVLNLKLPDNLAEPLTAQIISAVRRLYVQRYALFWQFQLTHIQLQPFQNLNQARQLTASFYQENSPLLALIKQVENNLQPIANLPEAAAVMSTHQAISQFIENSHAQTSLQKSLSDLDHYLAAITENEDPGRAALTAAQMRMKKHGRNDPITQLLSEAKSAPAPVNGWLRTLSINTWRSMLQSSRSYLNLLWLAEVWPAYHEHIQNRYPIVKDAATDMSLAEFTQFFSSQGTLDSFITRNLLAFVDNSQLYWQWKYVDGEHLNIPQAHLEMLNRATLIRRMYFADNQKTPAVQFSLTPSSMQLMSGNYLLNLEGQEINYLRDFRAAKKITWPGPKSGLASLEFNTSAGNTSWQETGEWAVFKLLDRANWTNTANTSFYTLNFTSNGMMVPYELVADKPINPFIPKLMSEFRCPEKL